MIVLYLIYVNILPRELHSILYIIDINFSSSNHNHHRHRQRVHALGASVEIELKMDWQGCK